MSINLHDILTDPQLKSKDKYLIVLSQFSQAVSISEIKRLAVENGFRQAEHDNVSAVFARLPGLAARTTKGWLITTNGKNRVNSLLPKGNLVSSDPLYDQLRASSAQITDPDTITFVNEAILCVELGLWRAAIIMSWVGAFSLLQNNILNNHLHQFNIEAAKRWPKWRAAKSRDDLSLIKEVDSLDIMSSIGAISKNCKNELKICLDRRNSCGHPNSFKIGSHLVLAHLESLLLNVYIPYSS